ncbi:uncharacterized protein LOC142587278 [Dermacentor variabilis]|uniref:uncharacterized protein LOC142587278 n=1 Tax=Dermacentor variabilis TaxID=34621 RepID=UPI003F5B954D
MKSCSSVIRTNTSAYCASAARIFFELLARVQHTIERQETIVRPSVPAKTRLQITLRFLAAGRREFPRRRYLGRNPRIPFTSVQVSALEAQFAVTRYLSGAQVHSIAVALGLTETRVKIWFQNRRAREKRERQPYHLTEHGSTAAQSAALGASLAAETVHLTPTMGFDLSRPLHERLHSPTVLAPSGLETVSTRQVSLNRSGTNFFPPFMYWPALPVLQCSTQASDSLP